MATQKIPGRAIKIGTDTIGDVTYFDGSSWVRLPIGNPDDVLTMNDAGTFPQWHDRYALQGQQYGYMMGSAGNGEDQCLIDRFSLTSQTNAVAVGTMLIVTFGSTSSGSSSQTHGYSAGHVSYAGPQVFSNVIQKVSFAVAEADSTDVANLTVARTSAGGATAINEQYGYCVAGHHTIPSSINTIDKYPFASDSDATDVGDVTEPLLYYTGGSNSQTHGYRAGGYVNLPLNAGSEVIDKWPFASDTNATDVGNLLGVYAHVGAGFSSETHGYTFGGLINYDVNSGHIEKYSFATDGNSTDVGDMTQPRYLSGGVSGKDHGYICGGQSGSGQPENRIERVAYATDTNAVDWADLTKQKSAGAGVQY